MALKSGISPIADYESCWCCGFFLGYFTEAFTPKPNTGVRPTLSLQENISLRIKVKFMALVIAALLTEVSHLTHDQETCTVRNVYSTRNFHKQPTNKTAQFCSHALVQVSGRH